MRRTPGGDCRWGALLLTAVFAVYAYLQKGESVKQAAPATPGRLATAALLNQPKHLDLAALLSIEGDRAADGFEARNSLLLSLQASPGLITFLHHREAVYSAAFSPDGELLASAGADNMVWAVGRGTPPAAGRAARRPYGFCA